MTIIRDIRIENFRGINSLEWFPSEGINCLIGPGDGGKSTILDAIEYTIGARRNIQFTDADFHKCNVEDPIIIDITLGKLDRELSTIESYGHFLRGWNRTSRVYENETSADLETVLTVRLTVRDDLEPEWSLYCDGLAADGRERGLNWKHRQQVAPTRLGTTAAYHMALGPRSILGKLSDDTTQASKALASAARQARKAFADEGCDGVDDILTISQEIANSMGIAAEELKALLDVRGVSFSGGAIALHDKHHVPLKSLGSGSMRLLVAGLQKSVGNSSISIIDEVEFGLEPYRILRLLDALGAKTDDRSHQVFMTSHSPIVLRELASAQLAIVRAQIKSLLPDQIEGVPAGPPIQVTVNEVYLLGGDVEAQKTLRACAEAFLAPNVIVCEGKTEIGLLRGMDLYEQDNGRRSIVAHGTHWADGGGSTMYARAKTFAKLGYRTALFMDSDELPSAQMFADLTEAGVTVIRWPDGLSTETAIFNSVPTQIIPSLLGIACDWKSEESVDGKIRQVSTGRYNLTDCRTQFEDNMRLVLGQCAGEKKWFKDIDPAERMMRRVIAPVWNNVGEDLKGSINAIWAWVNASPTAQPVDPVVAPVVVV